jgi:cytochrome c-type biogenesis protein CcmH
MAGDMRALVRTRIEAGEEPAAVRKWLIERYGNWVSYEPPLDRLTCVCRATALWPSVKT